jgi:hypothetical protein
MKTIIDKNSGKLLYAVLEVENLQSNELAIDELLTETFVNPYFNFETRTFYENATEQEIAESIEIPQEVQLWRVRTILKLSGLESNIETALNGLDEPMKTGALYVWNYGTTIERQSATVQLLQYILGLTDTQVDDIFIQANAIQI